MQPSLLNKLAALAARHRELGEQLGAAAVIADQNRYRDLSREFAELDAVARCFENYRKAQSELEDARQQRETAGGDAELEAVADELVGMSEAQIAQLEGELQRLLVPRDPDDARNAFLEIRAGTGGDEAAIFSGDLFRMYSRYAESRKWKVAVLSARPGEHGGYKEVIARIDGRDAYAHLKFESGAHRVQRVPATEAQGRIHTSACTVAVLPEAAAVDEIEINRGDLRVDTYRASGAGGQHVNKTDSAVRITHLPTGIVIECQDERSQHKNRARAMSLLQAKLLSNAREKQAAEQAAERRNLVGSGDRSERIRTYNFPQRRITDHRINLSLHQLDEVLEGGLGALIEALRREHQAEQLAALSALGEAAAVGDAAVAGKANAAGKAHKAHKAEAAGKRRPSSR